MAEYTEQFESRLKQLKSEHWTKQQKAASLVNLKKPEGKSWDEFCEDIAVAEFEQHKHPIFKEDQEEKLEYEPNSEPVAQTSELPDQKPLEANQVPPNEHEVVRSGATLVTSTEVDAGRISEFSGISETYVVKDLAESADTNEGKGTAGNFTSDVSPEASQQPEYSYSTDFYKGLGIPTCSKCGDKHRHDELGNALCPVGASDCPVLEVEKANSK